jgi:hypothetical protein
VVHATSCHSIRAAESNMAVANMPHPGAVTADSRSVSVGPVNPTVGVGSISRPIISPMTPIRTRRITDRHTGRVAVVAVVIGRNRITIVVAIVICVGIAVSVAVSRSCKRSTN